MNTPIPSTLHSRASTNTVVLLANQKKIAKKVETFVSSCCIQDQKICSAIASAKESLNPTTESNAKNNKQILANLLAYIALISTQLNPNNFSDPEISRQAVSLLREIETLTPPQQLLFSANTNNVAIPKPSPTFLIEHPFDHEHTEHETLGSPGYTSFRNSETEDSWCKDVCSLGCTIC